jgi:hypothetical protein
MKFLYEKDLRTMQYNILISSRHDRVVSELADRYRLRKQEIRKRMMDTFDMILLENLPARYDVAVKNSEHEDTVARALGEELATRYIPLVDRESMQAIVEETRRRIREGDPVDSAIDMGLIQIREKILS